MHDDQHHLLFCGDSSVNGLPLTDGLPVSSDDVHVHELPQIPQRADLAVLQDLVRARTLISTGSTLQEIQKQPDVPHQSEPVPSDQHPDRPLRVIVVGSDAALGAVVTRLIRLDALWVEVGFIPQSGSIVAQAYGLPTKAEAAYRLARYGSAVPTCLIRDDKGAAVVGHATVSNISPGEVIVDDAVLLHTSPPTRWQKLTRTAPPTAVRLVPTLDAPGLAATTVANHGLLRTSAPTVLTGRALQAGGPALEVSIDGQPRPKTVEGVTFYRHLRDLQIVRL